MLPAVARSRQASIRLASTTSMPASSVPVQSVAQPTTGHRGHHCAADSPATVASQAASSRQIISTVNSLVASPLAGQTFAVVHLYGQQYLLHLGDLLAVQKDVPVGVGECIKLEKCLLVGAADWSLVGRPLLNRDLVQVEATVVEKTMSQTFFNMESKPRSRGYRRYRFQRFPQTMLRITR